MLPAKGFLARTQGIDDSLKESREIKRGDPELEIGIRAARSPGHSRERVKLRSNPWIALIRGSRDGGLPERASFAGIGISEPVTTNFSSCVAWSAGAGVV